MHGDRIRLGRSGGAEMVFLLADDRAPAQDKATTTAIGDLRQIAALLDGLRALGSGRVLDDVLALVLDSAIEVTGAERGFIMLARAEQRARVQAGARPRPADAARHQLRHQPQDSRGSVPHRRAADRRRPARRRAGERPHGHRRARHPQRAVRAAEAGALRRSRRRGARTSGASACCISTAARRDRSCPNSTRGALETLATEAAVAIENARLYRETMEKAQMEQEMRIAAEIQQALLPKAGHSGAFFRTAASSMPCRSIGGDFYDYVDLPDGAFGFALGDVAGKGPPAALLSAMMQGIFAAQAAAADTPCQTIARVNLALYKRGIESRFVTLMYGIARGRRPPDLLQRRPQPAAGRRARAACGGSKSAARSSACSRARPSRRRPSCSQPATG